MQNRVNDQPAFILHRRDFQESSLILELFTIDFGRISVLVKGARKRRDAAYFQTGHRLQLGWGGRSALKILTQIDCRPLQIPLKLYSCVFYVNELLLYLLPREQEQRDLFHRYQHLLLELAQHQADDSLEAVLRSFEMDLLQQLGLMPDLTMEHYSEQSVQAVLHYTFDMLTGLRRCEDGSEAGFCGGELLSIQQRRFDTTAVLKAAKRLMRKIIDYNLQGRTLQSRKLFQQLNKKP